jgi:acetylornithine deacetylase/succinyl-diaminopimelate desuccinylase-like protein
VVSGLTEQDTGADPASVVDLCRELVRIDTSNFGDGQGPGERAAAEYVAAVLADAGLAPLIVESAPGRASVVARWAGRDASRPALLLHGHLDVVPAQAEEWSVDPFAGEIRDGCLWGRGTVDMKDMVAMVLTVVRTWTAAGRRPPRDVVLAFVADEEAGGVLGAQWLVDHHPELFEGVSEAISEVGGFSLDVGGRRWYTVQTAEKGMAWMRLTATGRVGHGSMASPDNAVVRLAEAVVRLGRHPWPTRWNPTVREFFATLDASLPPVDGGTTGGGSAPDVARVLAALGPLARLVEPTLRDSTTPTVLRAGYKTNVVPGQASAYVDARFLPGRRDEFLATVDEIIGPHVRREQIVTFDGLEAPFDTPLVAAVSAAVTAEDPGAATLPYMLSGGTDNKAFARLGITGYGFVPLRLPAGLDFASLFHGVDERVPLDSLAFGVRVLDRLLATC